MKKVKLLIFFLFIFSSTFAYASNEDFDNWLKELADIGPLYPLVGSEGVWVTAVAFFWIWWHMAQIRIESQLDREQLEAIGELNDLYENISKDN